MRKEILVMTLIAVMLTVASTVTVLIRMSRKDLRASFLEQQNTLIDIMVAIKKKKACPLANVGYDIEQTTPQSQNQRGRPFFRS